MDFLHAHELKAIKSILGMQMIDIDFQYSISKACKICSPLHFGLKVKFPQSAKYLENLIIPKYWQVLSSTRFNCLPSAILDGWYYGVPYENRLCPYDEKETETL